MLRLDGYEGPIDFLLELARSQKVDLTRLSIVALVDQYLTAVEAPEARATLPERGDWLIAASWLVLLKSKFLVQAEDEPEGPEVESLRDGLLRAERREQVRHLAVWLERQNHLGHDVLARGMSTGPMPAAEALPGDLLDLLLACFDLLDEPKAAKPDLTPYVPSTLDVYPLAAVLEQLQVRLQEFPQGADLAALGRSFMLKGTMLHRRSGAAATFLGALELSKQGSATLAQDITLGPITIFPVQGGLLHFPENAPRVPD
ncbi:segregation/condensation protein A (plasmid) [Roseomonas mucosa]|uniref:segregation and condensation protein A n=1 Tax=Roseomonas mucosa TaxID=207340 RepID=UPI0030CEC8F2